MLAKYLDHLYKLECTLFRKINRQYERKLMSAYFRMITHLGSAVFSISFVTLLILFTDGLVQRIAITSALALSISHIPVAVTKKLYPRKRPYLVLDEIFVTDKPLKDHSFPSGHTTAIFSLITPFILYLPFGLITIFLIICAVSVGLSRMVLGLHYPSDVLAGCILGTVSGILVYRFMEMHFPFYF